MDWDEIGRVPMRKFFAIVEHVMQLQAEDDAVKFGQSRSAVAPVAAGEPVPFLEMAAKRIHSGDTARVIEAGKYGR